MHFEDAVRHLSAYLGDPTLKPDPSGAVAVAFGDLIVNLRPAHEGECFTLDARLGSMQSATPETLVAMMTENRWPMKSTTGVLGVDATGSAFLFFWINEPHLPGAQFQSLLERFARRAWRWSQYMESLAQEGGRERAPNANLGALA